MDIQGIKMSRLRLLHKAFEVHLLFLNIWSQFFRLNFRFLNGHRGLQLVLLRVCLWLGWKEKMWALAEVNSHKIIINRFLNDRSFMSGFSKWSSNYGHGFYDPLKLVPLWNRLVKLWSLIDTALNNCWGCDKLRNFQFQS